MSAKQEEKRQKFLNFANQNRQKGLESIDLFENVVWTKTRAAKKLGSGERNWTGKIVVQVSIAILLPPKNLCNLEEFLQHHYY